MITPEEFANRRQRLIEQLEPNSVAIINAGKQIIRNNDNEYPYRQHSDFHYLTGFDEPDAVAVFIPGREEGEYVLFNRERDPTMEMWVGPRAGQTGACEVYGANQAFSIKELDQRLPELLLGKQQLYWPLGREQDFDLRVINWINQLKLKVRAGFEAPSVFCDIAATIHEMRLIKSDAELELMARCGEFSAIAHIRAMQACQPGMMEYELEAELLAEFTANGSRSPAYPCIVGGGNNACVLHYTANNMPLRNNDLVLIDAGAEFEYYAADITRSFPINGKFSQEQQAIYNIVLAAQEAGIAKVAPGVEWNQLQITTDRVITEGLVGLGLLKGDVEKLLTEQACRRFYPHKFGHFLGIDVHDVGTYKVNGRWRKFEVGMVFTVEPGIYIPHNAEGVDSKWWGIGVRIEDDVALTAGGVRVLTAAVPKTITEIEDIMAQSR